MQIFDLKIVEARAIDPSPDRPTSAKAWHLKASGKINDMRVSFDDTMRGVNKKSNIFKNEAEKEFLSKINDVANAIAFSTKQY